MQDMILQLVLAITIGPGIMQIAQALPNPEEEALFRLYFGSFSPKTPNLYFCDNNSGAMTYQLPEIKDCDITDLATPSRIVPITIFTENPSLESIKGFLCRAEEQHETRSYFFWGSHSQSSHKSPITLTREECKHMVQTLMSPNKKPLVRLGEGIYGTHEKIDIDYVWPTTIERSVTNYYFSSVTITVSNADESVVASVPLTESCSYTDGFCPSTEGSILIWSDHLKKRCRLQELISTECLLTNEDRLTCPEVTMSISNLQPISYCQRG